MILATAIILIIILILTCILVVPFEICLNLSNHGFRFNGFFKLKWMKVKLIQREISSDNTKKEEQKEEKKEEKNEKFNLKRIIRIISLLWESSHYIIKIFYAFLKSVKIEQISIHAIIGLGSPVDTVVICGYLWSLTAFTSIFPKINIYIGSDFQREVIDGKITLKIKLRLFWIVVASLRALTKKPVRALLNELRKMR